MKCHRASLILACALGVMTLCGCVQDNIPREGEVSAQAGSVQWPALRALDDMAHRVDHLVEEGDVAALAEMAGSLRETAIQVATDTVPSGARDPEQVRVLQGDLRSLAESLADAEALGGEALAPVMGAFGSVTHRLMQAAGLPHVHGDAGHDHGTDIPKSLEDLEDLEGPGHYGGAILEIVDDHSIHAEMVLDPATGSLRVYALDEVEEPTTFDDALSAELVFAGWTSAGAEVSVPLAAVGTLSFEYMEGTDEKLKGAEWIAGRIRGKLRAGGTTHVIDADAGWPPADETDEHHGHHH